MSKSQHWYNKDGAYWEGYRSVNQAELVCAEVAADLHEIDLRKND